MTRHAYCNVCKKQVETTVRKPLETFQKVLWIIVIIATVGIAAIIYAFYIMNRKKDYCPTCFSRVQYSNEPFEKEKEEDIPLTPKEKILKKAGKKLEGKKEKEGRTPEEEGEIIKSENTFCPYCGEDIEPGSRKCPYCHTSLTTT
ncbi:MAG: zinc ribbon domain-containing protein [Candidatus Thorarchaeota archaeon]